MIKKENYTRFISTSPKFGFSLLYPVGWKVREIEEKDYSEVFIAGPRNEADTFTLSLIVSVIPAREKGGEFGTLDEAMAAYLAQYESSANFREISRAWGTIVGVDAVEIEISYTFPLPINSVNAKETPIIERKIMFKKGAQFYELAYTAVAEDYYAYLESFRDAVSTFKFRRERGEARVFRPLVTLTPTYAVREKPEGYETES